MRTATAVPTPAGAGHAATEPADSRPQIRAALPPLALYVHLPWCARKCPYCDFNSYRSPAGIPEDAYLAALLADLENDLPLTHERALESIFIGGGTPSLFSGSAIRRLIDGIRARLHVPDSVEISLEANPGSAEAGRFAAYRAAGVNRLSIGFQSLRDAPLRALGRVHSAAEALAAFQAARRAGFGNINIDVMYALPDDTVAGALADLEQGLALDPEHVSWYQLTLEPQTAFFRRPPALPPDDAVLDIERQGRQRLAEHGFERYEVSAYARTGRRCRHNLNYWQFGDYLGIGAGAHSKLTMPDDAAILRREKTRNPRSYMAEAGRGPLATETRIGDSAALTLEFLMNALRLPDGVDSALFEARTGLPLATIAAPLAEAQRRGWMAGDSARLKPTDTGLNYLNAVLALF